MVRARVLNLPEIKEDNIVFDIQLERHKRAAEIVRVTTKEPGALMVASSELPDDVVRVVCNEVADWIARQPRFMATLYERLEGESARAPTRSYARQKAAPSIGASGEALDEADPIDSRCDLCAGTRECERFGETIGERTRSAFQPRTGAPPARRGGTFVPCPSCRWTDFEQIFGNDVPRETLTLKLERLEILISGRSAAMRERTRLIAAGDRDPSSRRFNRS